MDQESKVRQHVRELKAFYTNLTIYGSVCTFCVILWICMGAGPFWPIWVMLGCGLAALLEGLRLDRLPQLEERLPYLRSDWEEEQVNRLLHKEVETPKKTEKTVKSLEPIIPEIIIEKNAPETKRHKKDSTSPIE